jgi:hypothetical protein
MFKKKKNRFIIGGFVCMEDFLSVVIYVWRCGGSGSDQHPRVAVSVTEGKKKKKKKFVMNHLIGIRAS